MRTIPIAFPEDLAEQREITAALDAIDRKIDLHKEKTSRLEELSETLLYKVMTGAVCAEDMDLSALADAPALRGPVA